jgi:tRNA U34 2-thiouridine synthase MnmA/TrmU
LRLDILDCTFSHLFGILTLMKIAVAMSGGVDSSAAAAILKEQGHDLGRLYECSCGISGAASTLTKTATRCRRVVAHSTTFTTLGRVAEGLGISVLRA